MYTVENKLKEWWCNKYNPSDNNALVGEVVSYFKDAGWECKPTSVQYIFRKPKHHTKIEWRVGWDAPHWRHQEYRFSKFTLKAKTPHGGWETICEGSGAPIQDFLKRALEIPAPTLISKDSLPEPRQFVFQNPYNYERRGSDVWVSNKSQLNWAKVVGAVGLEKDGGISSREIYDPNEEVWFHIRLVPHEYSVAEIITDGEIYHPIKTSGKARVTPDDHTAMKHLSEIDRNLIKMAISAYLGAVEENSEQQTVGLAH